MYDVYVIRKRDGYVTLWLARLPEISQAERRASWWRPRVERDTDGECTVCVLPTPLLPDGTPDPIICDPDGWKRRMEDLENLEG